MGRYKNGCIHDVSEQKVIVQVPISVTKCSIRLVKQFVTETVIHLFWALVYAYAQHARGSCKCSHANLSFFKLELKS